MLHLVSPGLLVAEVSAFVQTSRHPDGGYGSIDLTFGPYQEYKYICTYIYTERDLQRLFSLSHTYEYTLKGIITIEFLIESIGRLAPVLQLLNSLQVC